MFCQIGVIFTERNWQGESQSQQKNNFMCLQFPLKHYNLLGRDGTKIKGLKDDINNLA